MNNALRYRDGSHPAQVQLTPAYVLEPVVEALGGSLDLDPCTLPDNPCGARWFFTIEDDGLSKSWAGHPTIFVNPPYSKAREPWVHHCIEAAALGSRVVLLMPAATDTRIFQEALQKASSVVFIKGRVKFGVLRENRRQMAASHGSALIGWNVDLAPCALLGTLVQLKASEALDV